MISFSEDIQIINLELFDASFAVKPGTEDEVKRRFMTLLVSETGRHRGGSADVHRATNLVGETFALKCLHTQEGTPALGGTPGGSGPQVPVRKVLRNTSGSSGSYGSSGTPDYVTEGHVAAFYEEYRIHLSVSHLRGFPRLYGFGLVGGSPLLIMEWVEGVTLRDALRERSSTTDEPLPLSTVTSLGTSVLKVLLRAAELDERFVHRDLSPRNIMLRTDNVAAATQLETGDFDLCLVDFGSATLTPDAALDASFTLDSSIWRMGTPAYAPPEMLTSDVALPKGTRQSPVIDVYALSSVLYELYGGAVPFARGKGDARSAYRLKTETEAPPLALREPDGGGLAALIALGLSARQEDRPSVTACLSALEAWSVDPSQPAQPHAMARSRTPEESLASRMHSRRGFLSALIVGTATLASGAIVGSKLLKRSASAIDPSRYSQTSTLYDGEPLFVAYDGDLRTWLLCTASGQIVCKPQSTRPCGALRERLISLYDDISERFGYVTPAKTSDGYAWAILPAFAQGDDFSEGYAAAQDPTSKLWGLIDTAGAWAAAPQAHALGRHAQGVVAAQTVDGARLWGAMDASGSWVIEPRFVTLGTRSPEGFAVAEEDPGSWGIVDETGAWTSSKRYALLRRFAGGCAPAFDADRGLWGFVGAQGAWTVEPAFRDARPFHEADGQWLAAVQDNATQLWYFVEADGTAHTGMEPRFWKLGDLHDGLAPAQASAQDDTVIFDAENPDAYATAAGMRYGYVDAAGAWQMRNLTELTDTAIGSPEI